MKIYKAIDTVTISCGRVIVDESQLRRRQHCLSDNGDGTHLVMKSIQFKRGETFGSDIVVNKLTTSTMEEIETDIDTTSEVVTDEEEITEEEIIIEVSEVETLESYVDLDKDTLKRELEYRGVTYKVNDTKPALIELLEQDDAINATD